MNVDRAGLGERQIRVRYRGHARWVLTAVLLFATVFVGALALDRRSTSRFQRAVAQVELLTQRSRDNPDARLSREAVEGVLGSPHAVDDASGVLRWRWCHNGAEVFVSFSSREERIVEARM